MEPKEKDGFPWPFQRTTTLSNQQKKKPRGFNWHCIDSPKFSGSEKERWTRIDVISKAVDVDETEKNEQKIRRGD